jgi:hypothetical protein
MAGLVSAIHVLSLRDAKDVDARHKVYPWAGQETGPEGRA